VCASATSKRNQRTVSMSNSSSNRANAVSSYMEKWSQPRPRDSSSNLLRGLDVCAPCARTLRSHSSAQCCLPDHKPTASKTA